jgi:hypothetical protein
MVASIGGAESGTGTGSSLVWFVGGVALIVVIAIVIRLGLVRRSRP